MYFVTEEDGLREEGMETKEGVEGEDGDEEEGVIGGMGTNFGP